MVMLRSLILIAAVSLGLAMPAPSRGAADTPLEAFFGKYEGASLRPLTESQSRDLKVTIRPVGDGGFAVDWQTTLFDDDDDARRKTQSLAFRPAGDAGAFYVATEDGLNVGLSPTETLFDGAPQAWARITGAVLTIHVLTVTEDGSWVMQTYDRALVKNGLALAFSRLRNGDAEKRLWGSLERIED